MNTDNISVIKELKSLLRFEFGENINELILFGSRMKKNYIKGSSDYDILIILKNDYDWQYKNRIISVVYSMELKYDIFIDIKVISLNELKNGLKGKQPLFLDAIKEGLYA